MAKSGQRKRPNLVSVSEEMRRKSMLLVEELVHWPDVRVQTMFGMRALYRSTVVFAMLPDKRALGSPTAIANKLPAGARKREGQKWRLFELEEDSDLANALACLDKAYRNAGPMHVSSDTTE